MAIVTIHDDPGHPILGDEGFVRILELDDQPVQFLIQQSIHRLEQFRQRLRGGAFRRAVLPRLGLQLGERV